MKGALLFLFSYCWLSEGKVLDWPGKNQATNADKVNEFGENLSGLSYESLDSNESDKFMYAIQNDPSTLYKLYWSGKNWLPVQTDYWSAGKLLHYGNGKGNPDSEDLTMTDDSSGSVYAASEKDNDDSGTKRISVLMFEDLDKTTTLSATREWILAELNSISTDVKNGIEAITWIPDDFLVAHGFYDSLRKATYDPSQYPGHGSGLFFVGMERKMLSIVFISL